jgi:hypothetical protein
MPCLAILYESCLQDNWACCLAMGLRNLLKKGYTSLWDIIVYWAAVFPLPIFIV